MDKIEHTLKVLTLVLESIALQESQDAKRLEAFELETQLLKQSNESVKSELELKSTQIQDLVRFINCLEKSIDFPI